jgi:hypothetical protein
MATNTGIFFNLDVKESKKDQVKFMAPALDICVKGIDEIF